MTQAKSGKLTEPVSLWGRQRYAGALCINVCAFLLPALYSTLSKLWVAKLDSSMVVTTDVFTYIGTIAAVLNEGLPRAAWNIIADKTNRSLSERYSLSFTLILFQSVAGTLLSVGILAGAGRFAVAFVPEAVRTASLTYVRISAFTVLSSNLGTAVTCCARAMDQPDVSLSISCAQFLINIILDLLLISKWHVGSFTPTVNTQAVNQLVCNMVASVVGTGYFLHTALRDWRKSSDREHARMTMRPSFARLLLLSKTGILTFAESAFRNVLDLWLVSGIVAVGSTYATAWGVFSTIRNGLVMVPVLALETTSLTFIGHNWGQWRATLGTHTRQPAATIKQLQRISFPALVSCLIGIVVEVTLCIFMTLFGIQPFAYYLSGSRPVAELVKTMWKSIDWCYIFYAITVQLATILLATRPSWYVCMSLVANLTWVLPWAIVCNTAGLRPDNAWKYHSVVFGGSILYSLFVLVVAVWIWAWTLRRGRMSLPRIVAELPDTGREGIPLTS